MLDTPFNKAVRVLPAVACLSDAAPGDTEKFDPPPVIDQAPPISALPKPPDTVRLNESAAMTVDDGGAVTVTLCVTVAVAPWLSVTVSLTGYVPAAE